MGSIAFIAQNGLTTMVTSPFHELTCGLRADVSLQSQTAAMEHNGVLVTATESATIPCVKDISQDASAIFVELGVITFEATLLSSSAAHSQEQDSWLLASQLW